jgi:hypothetical protein
MTQSDLQAKLIRAARLEKPSDAVPYAFEKRVMARLGERGTDALGYWAQSLWRAVAPCAAIAMVLGVWTYVASPELASSPEEFAQHFESTVLADTVSAEFYTE